MVVTEEEVNDILPVFRGLAHDFSPKHKTSSRFEWSVVRLK